MADKQFRAALNWFMCSDPWPTTTQERDIIEDMLDAESRKRGHSHWVTAYHEFKVT